MNASSPHLRPSRRSARRRTAGVALVTAAATGLALAGAAPAAAATAVTQRIIVTSPGQPPMYGAYPAISGDGRYVAFSAGDIFVRDMWTRTMKRASLSMTGGLANGYSGYPAISRDGRYVAFHSDASDLVPNDTNGSTDVFVRDMLTSKTTRVDVSSNGAQADDPLGNHISAVSPTISADGRYVAFDANADNLVPGDGNHRTDVFVHDMQSGTTRLVSVDKNGPQGTHVSYQNAISADGHSVVFSSVAGNLLPTDHNHLPDVFLKDLTTGVLRLVSVDSSGHQANASSWYPTVSSTGRYIAFTSSATNLVPKDRNNAADVFVHDMVTGATRLVSASSAGVQSDRRSGDSTSSISDSGRYVLFESEGNNLVPGFVASPQGMTFLYLRDLVAKKTRVVSVSYTGGPPNGWSFSPVLSGNARYLAFSSQASNLIAGQTARVQDIYRYGPLY